MRPEERVQDVVPKQKPLPEPEPSADPAGEDADFPVINFGRMLIGRDERLLEMLRSCLRHREMRRFETAPALKAAPEAAKSGQNCAAPAPSDSEETEEEHGLDETERQVSRLVELIRHLRSCFETINSPLLPIDAVQAMEEGIATRPGIQAMLMRQVPFIIAQMFRTW